MTNLASFVLVVGCPAAHDPVSLNLYKRNDEQKVHREDAMDRSNLVDVDVSAFLPFQLSKNLPCCQSELKARVEEMSRRSPMIIFWKKYFGGTRFQIHFARQPPVF